MPKYNLTWHTLDVAEVKAIRVCRVNNLGVLVGGCVTDHDLQCLCVQLNLELNSRNVMTLKLHLPNQGPV